MLRPFIFLIDAFIATFGITQPTREGAQRAARFLAWVVLVLVTALAGAILLVRLSFFRS